MLVPGGRHRLPRPGDALPRGLGLLPCSNTVHYDGERKRDSAYRRFLLDGMAAGYAAEDGAALHFIGERLARVVTSRPSARAYRMRAAGGRIVKTALSARYLGAPHCRRGVSGRRPRIIAIGGGGFSSGFEDAALDLFALSLTGRSMPRVCLLPTASGDPEEQIRRFYGFFHGRACDPSHVSLFRLESAGIDLREHLMAQDLIYVGGGSLLNLIAIWRVHGIDEILRDAWQNGTVLCGLSAGSMCWFERGITTSTGPPSAAAAWASSRAATRSTGRASRGAAVFPRGGANGMPAGYGVDDGAALVFKGTRLHEVVAARGRAGAWRVERDPDSGEVTERAMDVRRLAAPDEAAERGTPAEVLELRAIRRGAALARRHARRVG